MYKNKISSLLVLLLAFFLFSCEEEDSYRAVMDDLLVTSINPSSGDEKDIVFINGKNFSEVRNENTVTFNGIQAVVLEASRNQLEVVTPEGGETGNVVVAVGGQEMEGPIFTYTPKTSNYFVRTIVGSTPGFEDGIGTAAKIDRPSGLAFDNEGNLIFVDRDNHSIRKMTPEGVVTTIAGTGEAGFADGIPGQFNFPWQLVVDAEGNIIVVEKAGGRIRKIAPDGTVSTLAGPKGSGSHQGFENGPGELAQFNDPLDIVMDAEGNFYVTDRDNKMIRKITPEGEVSTLIGDGTSNILKNPLALTFDEQGNLIIADGNWLKLLTPAGDLSIIAGTGNRGFSDGDALSAKLGNMYDVIVDAEGNILIADASNHRIRMLIPGPDGKYSTGTITTIAGTGAKGRADGPGNASTFDNPYGLAVDEAGDIYVADIINSLIRKITLE